MQCETKSRSIAKAFSWRTLATLTTQPVSFSPLPAACAARDSRGSYQKARRGELQHFPGVNAKYEEPATPQIIIEVDKLDPEEAKNKVLDYLDTKLLNGKI